MGLFDRFAGGGNDADEADDEQDDEIGTDDVIGEGWPPDIFDDPSAATFAAMADHLVEEAGEDAFGGDAYDLDLTPATLDELDEFAYNLGGQVPSPTYLDFQGVTVTGDSDKADVLRYVTAWLGAYYGEVLVRDGGRWDGTDGHWRVWYRGQRVDTFRLALAAYIDDTSFVADYESRRGGQEAT